MSNPIKEFRSQHGWTLLDLAGEVGVHVQAVFLCEHGVYPEILPVLRDFLIRHGMSGVAIDEAYHFYQRDNRNAARRLYDMANVTLPAPGPRHPVVDFRLSLGKGLSRMRFCKSFCVHPAEMYNLEHGTKHVLSEQFKTAMLESGLSATVLGELEFRCGEFARNEWVGVNG
jgi:hypothetical protein